MAPKETLARESLEKLLKLNWVYLIALLLSVLRGHSVFSSPPQRLMTSDFEGQKSSVKFFCFFKYKKIALLFG